MELDVHTRPTLPTPPPRIDTAADAFFALADVPIVVEEPDVTAVLAWQLRRAFYLRVVGTVCALCGMLVAAAIVL